MKHLLFTFLTLFICFSGSTAAARKVKILSNTVDSIQTNKAYDNISQQKKDTTKVLDDTSPAVNNEQIDSMPIKQPDALWNMISGYILKKYKIGILIIGILWGLWKEREHIKALLSPIYRWFPSSISKGAPNKFSMFIADLESDHNGEMKKLILEGLHDEFKDIQVLPYKGNIQSHEEAKIILAKGNGEVLIWGKVLSKDNNSVPKLFWTTSDESNLQKQEDRYPITNPDLSLPELFWDDLVTVLRLLIAKQYSEFLGKEGHYIADILKPYIEKTRELIQSGNKRIKPSIRTEISIFLADALCIFGEQSGTNEPLIESIKVYREALKEYTKEKVPLKWAAIQNNLGNALCSLGERESGTERLEEAVEAYREALKVFIESNASYSVQVTEENIKKVLEVMRRKK